MNMYTVPAVYRLIRRICGLTLVVLVVAGSHTPVLAGESFTITTDLYAGFDISEQMSELDPTVITLIIGNGQEIETISAPVLASLFEFSDRVDLFFSLTTDATLPVALVAENLQGLALLDDTDFASVSDGMLAQLDLNKDISDIPIDSSDLVVLMTGDDEYIVLGNVRLLPDAQVQFSYRQIDAGSHGNSGEVPEPGTLFLMAAGIAGLIGIVTRKSYTQEGGKPMKTGKIVLLTLMWLPLLVGIVSAAEITVIKVGTGEGVVRGEDIFCGPFCQKMYEEKTIIHLKASPFEGSTFAGWMVNGKPHQGVLTVEDMDLVVAAKFEQNIPQDASTFLWYNGNAKERTTLVFDEIAVFSEDLDTWNATTGEEYTAIMQEVAQQFHSEATITEFNGAIIYVKAPEPIEQEKFPDILSALQESRYVKQVSPVFYRNPERDSSRMVLTGEIYVQFPSGYANNKIEAIEQEYGLNRVESHDDIGLVNAFSYTVDDPLKALEVTKRLYESGLVIASYPEWIGTTSTESYANDEFFPDQWHLDSINILPAWKRGFQGTHEEVIAIVDDGIEITHEDLFLNVKDKLYYDYVDEDDNPIPSLIQAPSVTVPNPQLFPTKFYHGTAVAGIVSGRCFNNVGICGVAPFSGLAGYRLLGKNSALNFKRTLTRDRDEVDVYNFSWGSGDMLRKIDEKTIHGAIETGTKKWENIYVWSAGNKKTIEIDGENKSDARNANYDAYKTSPYSIIVAASNKHGTHADYSASGANIMVSWLMLLPGTHFMEFLQRIILENMGITLIIVKNFSVIILIPTIQTHLVELPPQPLKCQELLL